MRLSPATRLTDRQTIWVAYRNDGSNFNRLTPPWGTDAATWAGQFAETHAQEAQEALPTW
jgi:hypothetical protein